MRKDEVMACLRQSGVVAVIRTENPTDLVAVSKALAAGGLRFVEITLTVPGAGRHLCRHGRTPRPRGVYRAGTVFDAPAARAAILAAQFVVGPAFDPAMVRLCNSYGIAVMPGALTPREIFQAWKGGADAVKVFPPISADPATSRRSRSPCRKSSSCRPRASTSTRPPPMSRRGRSPWAAAVAW